MERQTPPGVRAEPQVTYHGPLDMQVCVPNSWTDEEVVAFAERKNPCGTTNGWKIRKQGDPALRGANERVACSDFAGYVHIMLDA